MQNCAQRTRMAYFGLFLQMLERLANFRYYKEAATTESFFPHVLITMTLEKAFGVHICIHWVPFLTPSRLYSCHCTALDLLLLPLPFPLLSLFNFCFVLQLFGLPLASICD